MIVLAAAWTYICEQRWHCKVEGEIFTEKVGMVKIRSQVELKSLPLTTAVVRAGVTRDTWCSEHLQGEGRHLWEIIYLANLEFDCLLDSLFCAVVREITEAGNLASLNSGVGGDALLSGGHLVICESAEVIKLLFRFLTEGATWGVHRESTGLSRREQRQRATRGRQHAGGLCELQKML